MARIIYFEGEPVTRANKRIDGWRIRALNALVADEDAANHTGHFVFLILGRRGDAQNGHGHCQDCDYGLFRRHFPSRMRDSRFASVMPRVA